MSAPTPKGQRTGHRAPTLALVKPMRSLTADEHDRLLDDLAEADHRVDCELDDRERYEEAA